MKRDKSSVSDVIGDFETPRPADIKLAPRLLRPQKQLRAPPSFTDFVKVPKRLLPVKNAACAQQQEKASLYNCCPQAALIDREMEARMSGFALRQNVMNAQRARAKTAIKPIPAPRKDSGQQLSSSGRRNEAALQEIIERQKPKPEEVFIDHSRAIEARDYILRVSKIRVDSQYQPYEYEYLDRKNPRFNIALVRPGK